MICYLGSQVLMTADNQHACTSDLPHSSYNIFPLHLSLIIQTITTWSRKISLKKLLPTARNMDLFSLQVKYMTDLSAVYDYGQNGVELKNNIRRYWWESMVKLNENIVGIDAAIFMHPRTWEASGHVAAFSDPLIDNRDSKKRYRADQLIEEYLQKIEDKIQKEVDKGS